MRENIGLFRAKRFHDCEWVEKLKEKANGECASLFVVKIPCDVEYTIEEYDGKEWIAEQHRTW